MWLQYIRGILESNSRAAYKYFPSLSVGYIDTQPVGGFSTGLQLNAAESLAFAV